MSQLVISPGVWTVPDCFTAQECDSWIEFSERRGFTPAPVGTELLPDLRNNERLLVDDPALALQVYRRVLPHIPAALEGWRAIGANERIRFYRYEAGQCFDWHYDGYFQRSNGECSRLSLLVYLSDACEGGETEFPDFRIEPQKRPGSALPPQPATPRRAGPPRSQVRLAHRRHVHPRAASYVTATRS